MQAEIINTEDKAKGVMEIPRAEVIIPSGVTSSGVVTTMGVQPREVAYVISDALFGDFEVLKSIGGGRPAWWLDTPRVGRSGSVKLNRLVEAFKAGHIIKDALFYAGISQDQWAYFVDVHPEFYGVKEACESYTTFAAVDTANGGVRTDPRLAFRYLENNEHPRFAKKRQVEPPQPIVQQTVQVAVSQNVDTTRIASIIEAAADSIIATKRGGEGAGPQGD